MLRALEQAKSALTEILQYRSGASDITQQFVGVALAEIERLEAEDAEAIAVIEAAALTPQALDILKQVHSRGLHGKTLAETARIILSASLLSYLPEGFRWCEPADGPKAGLRRDDA